MVSVFGKNSFQRWQPDKTTWRKQFLASLYDAQMLAFQEFPKDRLVAHKDQLVEGFKLLFTEADFKKSVDANTNTPSYLRKRVARVQKLCAEVLDGEPA
ncbi:hypothetical protein [uncultured Sphingomonas sp.]|uniref:hypothetical protein n=1 Tax=uncultured Sphingomonas sp. TaxID=158754 RepID=UPI0025FDB616|nr:hypothetical protein [uncultured Sphingomonas sp.]